VFTDENATGFEKLGAALSMLMPLMTTFNSLQALSTTLSNSDTMAKLANAAGMKIVSIFSKEAVIGKTAETGAVWANTAAWYANPIMWIALIIVGVIAALALLIGMIKKLTEWLITGEKIETKNCETLIENAKRTRELADANKELSTSVEELIDKYDEMNAKG
jgi:hypothetical protein